MIDLPIGFPILEFEECSLFAHQMILEQTMAENDIETEFEGLTFDDIKSEFPRVSSYFELQQKEGIGVAYYYHLVSNFRYYEECQDAYRGIIVNCDGNSSNITELPFTLLHEGREIEDMLTGVTTHEAVFLYLRAICESIAEFCFVDDPDVPNLDEIKSNLFEIKQCSSSFSIEHNDAQRIACRMNRELLTVTSKYSSGRQVRKINSSGIRRIAAKAKGRKDPYSKPWLTEFIKNNPDFPDPIKGGANKGSGEAEYDFSLVKPILIRHYGDYDWENI